MIRQLVEFSVTRKVTILMISIGLVAFGLVGVSRLPINLLPSLSYPSLTVQTEFSNAAPAEIEQLISRPVEEVVGVLEQSPSILLSIKGITKKIIEELTNKWNLFKNS